MKINSNLKINGKQRQFSLHNIKERIVRLNMFLVPET